mgnify:CR=1 FL=1
MTALAAAVLLGFGPLSSYVDETGKAVTPFLDNIILIITFIFFVPGMFYGYAVGKFRKLSEYGRSYVQANRYNGICDCFDVLQL